MRPRGPALVLGVLMASLVIAGCASPGKGASASSGSSAPGAGLKAEPGSIAGVVVDQTVKPIAGASVELTDVGKNTTTDKDGVFRFEDVQPGTHFVRAHHPLYDSSQQSVEVPESGAAKTVRLQLLRVIFAQPYAVVQKFDGFIVCSIGFSLYASEECGEGVGVPCQVPQPVGCHRWGGQGNNHAQWDFYLDGPFVRDLIVEMQWEPSAATLKEFQLNVGNDWTCDPTCIANFLNVTGGPSPLRTTVDFDDLQLKDRDGNKVNLTADTRFSTFVWPNWGSGDPQQLNVAIQQPYVQTATAFYYLPAPTDWSFMAGDQLPY